MRQRLETYILLSKLKDNSAAKCKKYCDWGHKNATNYNKKGFELLILVGRLGIIRNI